MSNILITGGAGYLGTNISFAELKKGNTVFILDDFKNSYTCHINKLKKLYPDNIKIYKGKVQDTQLLKSIFHNNIDYVIHLAAYKYVGESTCFPDLYMTNNMESLDTILDFSNKYRVKKFAFASSAVVYGNATVVPTDEIVPLSPLSPYAETKSLGEVKIARWSEKHKIPAIIFRFSNPIGAEPNLMLGDDSKKGISNLLPYIITSTINNKPMSFKGNDHQTPDGTAIRDYIYVCDLAHTVVEVLDIYNGKNTEIINVSRGKGFSVLEILKAVERGMTKEAQYSFSPKYPNEASISLLSPEKLHSNYQIYLDTPLDKIVESEIKFRQYLYNKLKRL